MADTIEQEFVAREVVLGGEKAVVKWEAVDDGPCRGFTMRCLPPGPTVGERQMFRITSDLFGPAIPFPTYPENPR